MALSHAQFLSKLINGVFTSDERAKVLRWHTRFAERSIVNQKQHLLPMYRTTKCSVCAFVNRCGVFQPGLGNKVRELDSAMHAAGVHLPVNWTVICILGGILMDVYTSSLDAEIDAWYLQPGDIIHHYMISSQCLYDRDTPMVALRDACSFLAKHSPMDNEEDNDMMEGEEGSHESEEKAAEDSKGQKDMAGSLVNHLISMMTPSDVSSGKCEDMAYLPLSDKAQAAVMHIPSSIMLKKAIPDQVLVEGNRGSIGNGPLTQADRYDNLYDIYTDIAMYDEGEKDRRECTETEEGHTEREPDKAITLMLETYQWMRALVNTASL